MSIAMMNAVWDSELDAKRKLVLLSLADNANDAGLCWPTQETIARRSSLSERTVRDYLHSLAGEGLITILELGNGRGISTRYRLNLDAIKAAKAAETDEIKAAKTDQKAEDTCRLTTILEPPIEPERETRAKTARLWMREIVGRDPANRAHLQVLDDLDAIHPQSCIDAVFGLAAGTREPWPYAKRVFDSCAAEGHMPRKRNGASERIQANRRGATGGGVHPRAAAAKPWD